MILQNIDTNINIASCTRDSGFRKTVVVYLTAVMIATALMELLFYIARNNITKSSIPYLSQILTYLLLGLLNARYLSKLCVQSFPFVKEFRWQLTAAGGLIIALVLIFAYKLIDLPGWQVVAGSVAAFLMPVAIKEAWVSILGLPGLKVVTWVCQETVTETTKLKFKKTKEVQFRLVKRTYPYVSKPELAMVKGSDYSAIDSLFYDLTMSLNRESVVVHCYDEHGTPYAWAFYVKDKVLGRRWLDPTASLMRNRITNNEIIVAKRTKTVL